MSGRDTTRDLEDAPVYGHDTAHGANSVSLKFEERDIQNTNFAGSLGREIFESSTSWLNSGKRLKWADSLRAFQGLHPANSKYTSNDYRYRSRLFRPKSRAMVRKAEASTAEAFFANEDVVNITAIDDDDKMQQASAEINKALLQYRLTSTIPWFLTLVGARQDAEVMGICIGKAYWKYAEKLSHTIQKPMMRPDLGTPMLGDDMQPIMEDYDVFLKTQDHPWVDLIAPENFRFDPGADWRNPIATSPYTIEMIPMYIADVMEKVNSGEWNYVSDSAIRGAVDLDDDTTRRSREQGRVPGKDSDAWKPRQFDICWIRENIIRNKGKDWHFFTLGSSGHLLTNPRPLEEVYLHGIRPYVCGFVLPEAHKVYPTSKVELIRDLQTQINDVSNLRLDNVKLALNPRQFVKAGQGIDPQDMRTFMPGKTVITSTKDDPRNSIMWDRPPDVTQSSYMENDKLNMDVDEITGGQSTSTMQAMPQVYRTTDNMQMLDSNASVLEEYDQKVFAETFVEPMIKHLVKLEQAYETDPVILAVAGQKAQLYQKFGMNEITDSLLKQELTVRVNVGLGATKPDKKLNNLTKAAGIIAQIFGPAASMGANFEEIVKEVFSSCGYKDGARFFMPGFDVHAAQQQMAQGQKKGGEDVQGKIQLAQAQQQAQAMQDQESHKMEMQEMALGHQQKMEEMQQKFQLEMQKMGHQMANKPQTNLQLKTDGDSLKNVLMPFAQEGDNHANQIKQMMAKQSESHGHILNAIHALVNTKQPPRKTRFIRDSKGKAIGAEEYV